MSAGKLNLIIEQGATFDEVLTWKDANDDPINLTNYTARMSIKDDYDGAELLSLTTANQRLVLGGAAGTITFNVSATDTAALTFDEAIYDLELEDSGGVVERLVEGNVKLNRNVTT